MTPRGHSVTVAFWEIVDKTASKIIATDDAAEAQWWELEHLPQLGLDHSDILNDPVKATDSINL